MVVTPLKTQVRHDCSAAELRAALLSVHRHLAVKAAQEAARGARFDVDTESADDRSSDNEDHNESRRKEAVVGTKRPAGGAGVRRGGGKAAVAAGDKVSRTDTAA